MEIGIDNIWSSPSALHFRVLVWVREGAYCYKHDAHIALADIETETLRHLIAAHTDLLEAPPDEPLPGLAHLK